MRAFLDANILFSAAYRDRSDLLIFFDLSRAGLLELTTSAFAIEEASRYIALKRPERTAECVRLAAELELAPAPSTTHIAVARATGLAAKDLPILAAALAAESDLLVTGDRAHFGGLFGKPVRQLVIQAPMDALRTIVVESRGRSAK